MNTIQKAPATDSKTGTTKKKTTTTTDGSKNKVGATIASSSAITDDIDIDVYIDDDIDALAAADAKRAKAERMAAKRAKAEAAKSSVVTEAPESESPKSEPEPETTDQPTEFVPIVPAKTKAKTQEIKIICNQAKLKEALDILTGIAPAKPTHPILANALIIANKDTQSCSLTVYDLSVGVQTVVDCKVAGEGETTLPIALLTDIVGKFPSDCEIVMTGKNDTINIHADAGKYTIKGISTEEFPELPAVFTIARSIPAETLKEGLKATIFAASKDETKQILTGVFFKLEQDRINLAATDGSRLAAIEGSTKGIGKKENTEVLEEIKCTIPARAMEKLLVIQNSTGTTSVEMLYNPETATVAFQSGKVKLVSRCLQGDYPNYPQLLEQNCFQQVIVDKAGIVKSLSRLGSLADKNEKTVKIDINVKEQELSLSIIRDFGSGEEVLAGAITCISGYAAKFNKQHYLYF
ncbi:DNA polymerase III subunit beta [Crinalium epipsammum]|uniref:DNA polymerase III subunit beta n=1 Tax=Crinalium epipsammum TaxID=241425 RepID=UPI0018DC9930|nr:DNA polymerase III subunit beta [Crinalium epipsammum]